MLFESVLEVAEAIRDVISGLHYIRNQVPLLGAKSRRFPDSFQLLVLCREDSDLFLLRTVRVFRAPRILDRCCELGAGQIQPERVVIELQLGDDPESLRIAIELGEVYETPIK